jgi:hypothetical protein
MLPNLTSFTNIYARINKFHERAIANVTIVHDEHDHYDHIIRDGKIMSEGLLNKGMNIPLRHSDFGFTENANLVFRRSLDCIGIQVADVLAGFVMRYVQERLNSDKSPGVEYYEIFQQILGFSTDREGPGVNFVLDVQDVRSLNASFTFGF